ncbi:MAG: nuclease-related domain-containing protein, partial [Lysinibacillus sp.]
MICLQRKTSSKIDVCEALLRRAYLQLEQQTYVEQLLQRSLVGSEGEYQMDWFWEDFNFQEAHFLFNNFETLKYNRFKYQMDSIFLCKRFILILECKHIAGDIYYHEETNQLWREYNGQRLILNDPFSQVMRHEEWMRQFLQNLKVDLPVYTAIVITTQSSSLNNMPRRFSIFKLP